MLGIYCRISGRKAKGKDTSIEFQKNKGEELARTLNIDFDLYVEKGVSGGADIQDRPEFYRLISDIESGIITHVFAIDQNRIERDTAVWSFFVATVVSAKAKYFPAGTYFDLEKPENVLFSDIKSAFNKHLRYAVGRGVKQSIRSKAKIGQFRGVPAFGYRLVKGELKIDADEAKIIEYIFQRIDEGASAYNVANELNEQSVPTKMNKYGGTMKRKYKDLGITYEYPRKELKWRGNVVCDIVKNTIYKGQKKIQDEFYPVAPIITETLWEQVNDKLVGNKKLVGKKPSFNYLLNGLLYCAHCGKPIRGKKRIVSNENVYKCSNNIGQKKSCHESSGINITKLDSFVLKLLFDTKYLRNYLAQIPVVDRKTRIKREIKEKEESLKNIKKPISNLVLKLEKSDYSEEILFNKLEELEKKQRDTGKEIKTLKNTLSDLLANQKILKSAVASSVDGKDFKSIKKILLDIIDKITIYTHKEKGKKPSFNVKITYKGLEESLTYLVLWSYLDWVCLGGSRQKALSYNDLYEDSSVLKYLLAKKGITTSEGVVEELRKSNTKLSQKEIDEHNPYSAKFKGMESSFSGIMKESKLHVRLIPDDLVDFNSEYH